MKELSAYLSPAVEKTFRLASGVAGEGVPSNIPELDKILNGMQKGEIIIIDSPSELLSSTLCYELVMNNANEQNESYKCGLISQRSPDLGEFALKILCKQAKIDLEPFIQNDVTTQDFVSLQAAAEKLSKMPINLEGKKYKVQELTSSVKEFSDKSCRLVFIDGLECTDLNSQSESEVKAFFDELRTSLRIHGMTLIAALRSSSSFVPEAIHEFCDVFIDIPKPDKFHVPLTEEHSTTLHLRKNKHGLTGIVELKFTHCPPSYISPTLQEQEEQAKAEAMESEPDAYWCEDTQQWITEHEV